MKNIIRLLWEYRTLKYVPRASLQFLKGSAKENVAEHSFYTTIIGWVLAKREKVDENKVIRMCLVHDLAEARRGERNLINKIYSGKDNELEIIKKVSGEYQVEDFSFDDLFKEFSEGETPESKIAQDADILAGMFLEKECLDLGNEKASKWLDFSLKRLETEKGKELGKMIIEKDSDQWWLDIVNKNL